MADEIQEAPEKKETFWQKLTSNYTFAGIVFAAGVICAILFIQFTDVDWNNLITRIVGVGVVFIVYMAYKFLHAGTKVKDEKVIATEPIALAIEHGLFALAVAWVWANAA
jgi:amino acid permease